MTWKLRNFLKDKIIEKKKKEWGNGSALIPILSTQK